MRTSAILTVTLLTALTVHAEPPKYYLNIYQSVTNPDAPGIEVSGVVVSNQAEALSLAQGYAADVDYFGNDIAFRAEFEIHWHNPNTPCVSTLILSHASSHTAPANMVELEEVLNVPDPQCCRPTKVRVAVSDDVDKARKIEKIAKDGPLKGKQYTVRGKE